MMDSPREQRVVVLGCGRHGERYLRHIVRGDVPGLRVAAIQRRDADAGRRLAAEYGVPYEQDADEAIARGADAAIVCSPPGEHLETLRRTLGGGLPTLCEKPVGRVEDWAELSELQRAHDGRVMVAQTLRFHPTLMALREQKDALGPVHRQRWCQRLEPSDLGWQRDRAAAGGGSILLTGVHLFDQVRWWWGRTPDAVIAETLSVEGHPFENVFTATFVFESEQRLVSVEVAKCSESRVGFVETVGTRGQRWTDYMTGRGHEIVGTHTRPLSLPAPGPTLPATLSAFAALVRGEAESVIPLSDGLETLRMAAACYHSAEEGRRVHLGEISPMVR